MYFPIVVVAMLGLVAMCAASDPYQKKAVFTESFHPRDPKGAEALDEIIKFLRVLEAIEEVQDNKIGRLGDSANANLNFQNDFNKFRKQRIVDEQRRQNACIKKLTDQIREIRSLQQKVDRFHRKAEGIRGIVNEVYTKRKQVMYGINDIRNAALNRQNRIEATQTRADNINDRTNALITKSDEERVLTSDLIFKAEITMDVANRVAALSEPLKVSPDGSDGSQAQTIAFHPEFIGVPQFVQTGFNAIYIQRKNSYYPNEYSSIYFMLGKNLMNNEVNVEAVDRSSGDFSVTKYVSQAAFAHFSTEVVPQIH